MARHVQDQDSKKYHLLKALHGKALDYINMGMTPATTNDQIWAMLDQWYDDPMAFNYNTLHRVFNTLQLLQPKSTQAH